MLAGTVGGIFYFVLLGWDGGAGSVQKHAHRPTHLARGVQKGRIAPGGCRLARLIAIPFRGIAFVDAGAPVAVADKQELRELRDVPGYLREKTADSFQQKENIGSKNEQHARGKYFFRRRLSLLFSLILVHHSRNGDVAETRRRPEGSSYRTP